jgi:hypothetical protein
MASYKERMSLLHKYAQLHLAKYGSKPTHNLNSEQWAADNLIESYGQYECYDLLEYYFSAHESPSWKHFAMRAEFVYNAMVQTKQDRIEREERRKMAKEWLNG